MANTPIFATDRLALHVPREFSALLAALQLRNPDTTRLTMLTDQEWSHLITFCELAHLMLPLAQLSIDGIPSWVVERLRTDLADNTLRFERIKATYLEAADALHRVGAEHIVIKGFTQVPDYVAAPGLRAQSDIDLYCPPESISAARAALESIGYRADEKTDVSHADHGPALIRSQNWRWKGNFFDPDMPLGIELHFCLWNEHILQFNIPVDSFWQRRIKRVVCGLAFSSLNSVDHLGHLALHILRNVLLHNWTVHHVHELAVFLHAHANDDAFWESWVYTHDSMLRAYEAIAFYLARDWFDCALHPQAENAIASLTPIRQQWLSHFSGSALEVMFRQNKDSLWLHLTFLSSSAAKRKIFRETMVPTRVAPLHSPTVQVRNKRLVQSGRHHLWLQYAIYFVSRSASHGLASLSTLQRGLLWRLGQHQFKS